MVGCKHSSTKRSRHGANRDPVAEPMGRNVGVESAAAARLQVRHQRWSAAGQVAKRSNCRDQQIVSFVWHHRSDERSRTTACCCHPPEIAGSLPGRTTLMHWLDAVISDHDPSVASLVTMTRGSGSAACLCLAEDLRLRGIKTGFQRKRLVHQRDEGRAKSERAGLGQGPERKPVENNRTAVWHRGQYHQRGRALRDGRERKAISQVEDIRLPTQPPKLVDDAPVIAITSGRRGKITRYGERNTPYLASVAHSPDPAMVAKARRTSRGRQAEHDTSLSRTSSCC